MNAMSSINFDLNTVAQVCQIHNVAMVKAGPFTTCPKCAVESVNNSNANHQKSVDEMVRVKHMTGAMLPERHAESGFKNYLVEHEGHKYALDKTVNYAKSILNGDKNNLIMAGRTGTGKTHLSCATAKTLLKKGKYTRYITSEDLAQKIMDAWDAPNETEKSVIYEFSQYDLLIIDEYGLHDRDKRRELVHKVLYARYDRLKPTMLISNMPLSELKKDLGDRLWSRFQQGVLTIIECGWNDHRLGGAV